MATTLGFKDIITKPSAAWQPLSPTPFSTVFHVGTSLVGDMRNNEDRHPVLFWLENTTSFLGYNVKNDNWQSLPSPAMGGTVGNGTSSTFCPSQGPSGTLAAGGTTTTVVLDTALPAAVAVNQLANRGDGRGFKIRIIGNSAGGSGLTEERIIIANSAGTQPTIQVDSAFSFTPAVGDGYEILSGRLFMLTTAAANGWKVYDVATNTTLASLSTVNLPTIGTDSSMISLDELYVPYTNDPGEGYYGNLTATASGAASLTGQAAGGDAGVLANEYRNFQLRIVTDVAIPTAVGQRRRITSHTAGASPVYTVAAWAVQPSATATYVIENDRDKILLWTGGQQLTYCYNIIANTWDSATWATRGAAMGAGIMSVHGFGVVPDTARNTRHSYIYSFRGGSVNTLDLFDIAGAATGAWTLNISYSPGNPIPSGVVGAGYSMCYCPATEYGKYSYINFSLQFQHIFRFDVYSRVIEPWGFLPFNSGAAGTQLTGNRLASTVFVDGATKLSFVNMLSSQTPYFWQCAITR